MKYTELRPGDLFAIDGSKEQYKFMRIRRSDKLIYLHCTVVINGVDQPGDTTYVRMEGRDAEWEIQLFGIDVMMYKALASCIAFIGRHIDHVGVESNALFDQVEAAQEAFEKQYPSYNS